MLVKQNNYKLYKWIHVTGLLNKFFYDLVPGVKRMIKKQQSLYVVYKGAVFTKYDEYLQLCTITTLHRDLSYLVVHKLTQALD